MISGVMRSQLAKISSVISTSSARQRNGPRSNNGQFTFLSTQMHLNILAPTSRGHDVEFAVRLVDQREEFQQVQCAAFYFKLVGEKSISQAGLADQHLHEQFVGVSFSVASASMSGCAGRWCRTALSLSSR